MSTLKSKISTQFNFNVLTFAALLILYWRCFSNSENIAYVDSAKLLSEYKGATIARQAYDNKAGTWKANIDTLNREIQIVVSKYERDVAGMSEKERQLMKQLIQTKQQQLANYQRAVQENANQESSKLMQGVVSDINAFLLKYGKEHHYKLILIANQSGTIAYAEKQLDITADVIKELNEKDGK